MRNFPRIDGRSIVCSENLLTSLKCAIAAVKLKLPWVFNKKPTVHKSVITRKIKNTIRGSFLHGMGFAVFDGYITGKAFEKKVKIENNIENETR